MDNAEQEGKRKYVLSKLRNKIGLELYSVIDGEMIREPEITPFDVVSDNDRFLRTCHFTMYNGKKTMLTGNLDHSVQAVVLKKNDDEEVDNGPKWTKVVASSDSSDFVLLDLPMTLLTN